MNQKGLYGIGFMCATLGFVTIYSGFSGQSLGDLLTLKGSSGGTKAPANATVDNDANGTTGPASPATGVGDLDAMHAWCDSVANKYPYAWGGGHIIAGKPSPGTNHESGGPVVTGFDCSGAVSGALHAAGLLSTPRTSGGLMTWGEKGVGEDITVYASPTHTFMMTPWGWFGTGRLGDRGGVDWGNHDDTANYTARRPPSGSAAKSIKDSIR